MTGIIALTPEQIAIVKDILMAYLPKDAHVYVFGSRALGTAKPFSDIDLLIDLKRPLTLDELAKLSLAFEESNLAYKVDLADAVSISPEFNNAIKNQLIPLIF